MRVKLSEKAEEDLAKLDEDQKGKILDTVKELETSPLSREDVKPIREDHLGREVRFWRLKLKDANENLDHRVIFDYEQDKIIVHGIIHRDNCYTPDFYRNLGQ